MDSPFDRMTRRCALCTASSNRRLSAPTTPRPKTECLTWPLCTLNAFASNVTGLHLIGSPPESTPNPLKRKARLFTWKTCRHRQARVRGPEPPRLPQSFPKSTRLRSGGTWKPSAARLCGACAQRAQCAPCVCMCAHVPDVPTAPLCAAMNAAPMCEVWGGLAAWNAFDLRVELLRDESHEAGFDALSGVCLVSGFASQSSLMSTQ